MKQMDYTILRRLASLALQLHNVFDTCHILLIFVGAIFGANPLLGRGLKACIAPRQRLRTKNGICALGENALF